MKNLLLTITFLSLFSFTATAQQPEPCAAHNVHREKLLTDPVYAQRMAAFDSKNHAAAPKTLTTNIIPVVVHVMHKGEPVGEGTNLSDESIQNQIKSINNRLRKVPGTLGDGSGVDTQIELALAVRDPQGNCTNGIDRVNMSSVSQYVNYGVKRSSTNGIEDAELKAYSTWSTSQYYNIWVVSEIDNSTSGVAGYAYYASAHGMPIDGMIVLAGVFSDPEASTATHELGHALNLYHSFEGDDDGNACPVLENGCGSDNGDCCADTPPHIRTSNCNQSGVNSCDNDSTDLLYKFNFMNYSGDCRNAFTADQRNRMISALTGIRSSFLAGNGNMSLVPVSAPTAMFSIESGNILCSTGESVKLTDKSLCVPNTYMAETQWAGTSFNWIISNGQNTYTSTSQNPEITINNAGTYNVTLQVTTPAGTSTHTVQDAFYVNQGQTPIPDCEPASVTSGSYYYTVNNVMFNTINKSTSVSTSGPYENFICTDNTVVAPGQQYELSITLRANNSNPLGYRVLIDYNNDGYFANSEAVMGGIHPNGTTATYTETVTIPNNAVENTLLIMRVITDAGLLGDSEINCQGNLFISDTEDYGVYINSAMSAATFTNGNLSLYPNPATDSFTISASQQIETVVLYNMLGQIVLSQEVNSERGNINIATLGAGTYMVEAKAGGKSSYSKIIKK